jgi:nitroreductase
MRTFRGITVTFTPPEFGTPVPASHRSQEAIELLRFRRSTSPDMMTAPGPSAEELQSILYIASRVPDHRRVFPYRFIVFEGEARAAAGAILARAFRAANPQAEEKHVAIERNRFLRAPTVVGIVAKIDPNHKTPEWEQTLTVGAVGENLLIAARAHGFASCWLTEWYSYDPSVCGAFGLAGGERMAGFVYLGTAKEPPKERLRPELSAIVSRYEARK